MKESRSSSRPCLRPTDPNQRPANERRAAPNVRLSNKPVHPSRNIVQALGLGHFFVSVYGGNSFPTKKPDPQGAQTILHETGVAPDQALIIGDSSIDIQTGRKRRPLDLRRNLRLRPPHPRPSPQTSDRQSA